MENDFVAKIRTEIDNDEREALSHNHSCGHISTYRKLLDNGDDVITGDLALEWLRGNGFDTLTPWQACAIRNAFGNPLPCNKSRRSGAVAQQRFSVQSRMCRNPLRCNNFLKNI